MSQISDIDLNAFMRELSLQPAGVTLQAESNAILLPWLERFTPQARDRALELAAQAWVEATCSEEVLEFLPDVMAAHVATHIIAAAYKKTPVAQREERATKVLDTAATTLATEHALRQSLDRREQSPPAPNLRASQPSVIMVNSNAPSMTQRDGVIEVIDLTTQQSNPGTTNNGQPATNANVLPNGAQPSNNGTGSNNAQPAITTNPNAAPIPAPKKSPAPKKATRQKCDGCRFPRSQCICIPGEAQAGGITTTTVAPPAPVGQRQPQVRVVRQTQPPPVDHSSSSSEADENSSEESNHSHQSRKSTRSSRSNVLYETWPFRQLATLQTPATWHELIQDNRAATIESLERELRRRYLDENVSGFTRMVGNLLIDSLVLWTADASDPTGPQLQIDILERIRLYGKGSSTEVLDKFTTAVSNNEAGDRYKKALQKATEKKTAKAASATPSARVRDTDGTQPRDRFQKGGRQDKGGRLPKELWLSLTDDQKKLARKKK